MRVGACLLAALFALVLASAARAKSAAETRRLASEVIRALDIQAELPRATEATAAQSTPAQHVVNAATDLVTIVVLVVAAVMVVLFLTYARGDLLSLGRRSRETAEPATAAAGGDPQPSVPALGAADELALQGRFVEAMHMLLLESLAEIRRRLDERFADSLTSREILRRARLSEGVRASLREIIAQVEWTYFGKHPAGPADYQACRERFGALTQMLRGGAAA